MTEYHVLLDVICGPGGSRREKYVAVFRPSLHGNVRVVENHDFLRFVEELYRSRKHIKQQGDCSVIEYGTKFSDLYRMSAKGIFRALMRTELQSRKHRRHHKKR